MADLDMGLCYPSTTDWSCAGDIGEMDPNVKERSEALAWFTLASLSGYNIATCPTMVRPCRYRCSPGAYYVAPASSTGSFSPRIENGQWLNAPCGCGMRDCSCTTVRQIRLPGVVGGIDNVKIDGAALDPSAYRVDNGNMLVRQDGDQWPLCQDMNLPAGETNTFTVSFFPGVGPNGLTNYAAGVLAFEYSKACSGDSACRLPAGVTAISRQGVSYEIKTGMFEGGQTGIPEVDAIIRIFNPNALKGPSLVMSPDTMDARTTTWVSSS